MTKPKIMVKREVDLKLTLERETLRETFSVSAVIIEHIFGLSPFHALFAFIIKDGGEPRS